MHEARALPVRPGAAQRPEHAVEMARGPRAALHRKTHGLVEHHHVRVLIQRDRLDEGAVLLVFGGVLVRLWRVELQRRKTHGLPGLQPQLRLRALAVHAHLAFADDALDMAEGQARKPPFEKTVDTHPRLVGGNGDSLNFTCALKSLACD